MTEGEVFFEGRVALKAIIAAPSGRVLICKNFGDALWDLPGGTLNAGENPEAGLLREIREEMGIEPVLVRPLTTNTFIKPKTGKQVIVVVYEASLPSETNNFILDQTEIQEARWIGKDDLASVTLFPEYHRELEKYFARR